jgi:FkbM family methyltransferase
MRDRVWRLANRALARYELALVPRGHASGHDLRLRLFRQLSLSGFRPRHIVDVGAHRGLWSRDARSHFPGCAFTLIEPQAELAGELERFCAENPGSRAIIGGAGSEPGTLELVVKRHDPEGSSFAFDRDQARRLGLERRPVEIVTLDQVCAGAAPPELVKIDVEGFELEVLEGASTLVGVTELFFLEVSLLDLRGDHVARPGFHEVVERMAALGYDPFDLTDLIRRPRDGALALVELAFARRSGPLRAPGW